MDGYWKVYFELNQVSVDDTMQHCKRLSEKAEKAVFYLHPIKDRTGQQLPHVHGYLFNFSQSDDTLRNTIKKAFNVKGSQLSVSNTYERGTKMTEEHIDKYVSYMSKGQFDPLYLKGVSPEYCDSKKKEWKAPTSVRITGDLTIITNGTVKRKEITQFTMARELSVWILEKKAAKIRVNRDDIIKECVSILTRNNKSRHFRNVANICQDAMWDWDPDYTTSKILSML